MVFFHNFFSNNKQTLMFCSYSTLNKPTKATYLQWQVSKRLYYVKIKRYPLEFEWMKSTYLKSFFDIF